MLTSYSFFKVTQFQELVYKEGRVLIVKVLPGPTEKKIKNEKDIRDFEKFINKIDKHFVGFNFESGGWKMMISYNSYNWCISDSRIVVNNMEYKVSGNVLEDLLKVYEEINVQ